MTLAERIGEYLQRLTPLARSNLLTELERLELCDEPKSGSAALMEKLRAEFRPNGQAPGGSARPIRCVISSRRSNRCWLTAPPQHANSGRIQRGSLSAIWEWISRDLLPTMARDYTTQRMTDLIAADKQRGSPAGHFDVPDQGRQSSRKHNRLPGWRRSDPQ